MPIYVLRHERRFSSPKFFTSLTIKGLNNSELLIDKIKNLEIDLIFCSPFLRTVQTIYPYAANTSKKINIEYALYEAVKNDTFRKEDYLHDYTELYRVNNCFRGIINENYKSFLDKKGIDYPEDLNKIYSRLVPFLENLKTDYRDKNVLLVTHMTTALVISEYLLNGKKLVSDKDPTGNLFPMGFIKKVYN